MKKERKLYLISLDLQRFANDSGAGEKTESATPKKRKKAREEGQVVKSVEVTTAVMLVVMFSVLKVFGPWIWERLMGIMVEAFGLFQIDDITVKLSRNLYYYFIQEALITLLPILGVAYLVAFVTNIAQVGFKPTLKPLTPKLNRLSPIQGFKKIFSMRTIIELIKSILKLSIVFIIVYLTLKDYQKLVLRFYNLPLYQAYGVIVDIILDVGIRVGMYFLIVAAVDYAYQKYKSEKDLKMSKQEVKEEHKNTEGDPLIKSKIRQRMRQASMRRMMQNLPKADVVITNPTHFAVAIKYDEKSNGAPVVVAKGADLVAARIKEKAREYEIQIVENRPLARTLYYTVEIGQEIPPELYQAVAEVLAFVYSIKNRSALT